uniref:Uncharacterized protein n=1 Tax=Oryza brachyantha TaxID=4533 RepID=J3KTX3_ORYBR
MAKSGAEEWRRNADTHKMSAEEVRAAGVEASMRPPGRGTGTGETSSYDGKYMGRSQTEWVGLGQRYNELLNKYFYMKDDRSASEMLYEHGPYSPYRVDYADLELEMGC